MVSAFFYVFSLTYLSHNPFAIYNELQAFT